MNRCLDGDCVHNLVRGISTTDLLSGDGPYQPTHLVIAPGIIRGSR